MNCNNKINYQVSQSTAMPNNQANKLRSTDHMWSPFSTPLFTPYDVDSTTAASFQYSNSYSMSVASLQSRNESYKSANEKKINLDSGTQFVKNAIVHPVADYLPVNTWGTEQYSLIENKNVSNQSHCKLPKRSHQIDMSDIIRNAQVQKAIGGRAKMCTFCKTNGEEAAVYSSHSLKDSNDKITCPILLNYTCPECGAKGAKSHTKKYCPVLQKRLRMEMIKNMSANKEN